MLRLIKAIIIIYILNIAAILLHEMFHLIVAKLFRYKVDAIIIGDEEKAVKIGKWKIYPIAFSGATDVYIDEIRTKKDKYKVIAFFLSGICGNIILIAISIKLEVDFYSYFYVVFNIISIFISLLPIGGSDSMNLLDTLRK